MHTFQMKLIDHILLSANSIIFQLPSSSIIIDHTIMASSALLTLLLKVTLILCFASYLRPTISTVDHPTVPYLSPSTFSTDYQRMHSSFKIFPYALPPLNLTTRPSSSAAALFHSSLLSSRFITANPDEAHLFYLPIPPSLPTRSLDRVISRVRSSSPFWNRSLAADHFFLSSCSSAAPSSARNVVELRKNAVRLTDCLSGHWVPHKDVSLPPSPLNRSSLNRTDQTYKYLGFLKTGGSSSVRGGAALIEGLKADPEFLIESQPLNDERLGTTRFCLFWYGGGEGEVMGLGEALAYGCVPVVITDDRPIQDMPLMDVLRWQEMALFVGAGVGPAGLKRILNDVAAGDGYYESMRGLGEAAAQHFAWNDPPKPYDAFHMVVYQLWLRRHAVGYDTWEMR